MVLPAPPFAALLATDSGPLAPDAAHFFLF